jgi:hypothetical protein
MRNSSILIVTALLAAPAIAHAQGQRQTVTLPEGAGKNIVQVMCVQCHGLNMIANSGGYTRMGWRHVFGSMVKLRSEDADVVSEYLATHYPVKVRPEAVLIPGNARVSPL